MSVVSIVSLSDFGPPILFMIIFHRLEGEEEKEKIKNGKYVEKE
jgi:hypothetical protein